MLKKYMHEYEIDVVLMSSTDRRWNEGRYEITKNIFKSINENIELITSDSGENTKSANGYLPGGTLGLFTGKLAGMIVKDKTTKDKFGRWTSTRIEVG